MLFKQTMQKESLRTYEQVLVLHPDCSEQDHKQICSMTVNIIEKQTGKVFRMDTWGSRPIANPKAKKVSRGFYFYMLFSAPSEVISEIRKQFSINNKVLYFHQERLPKKEEPKNHIQNFLQHLEQTKEKERERLAKLHKKQNPIHRPQ